jgi:osmotically-inducible protein OsmY
MTRSAALLILPSQSEANKDVRQTGEQLLTQCLEDLHLAERVQRALCALGHRHLREIQVTAHARLVILKGRVPSYYLKQLAQDTALAVPGAHQIRNDLEVSRSS